MITAITLTVNIQADPKKYKDLENYAGLIMHLTRFAFDHTVNGDYKGFYNRDGIQITGVDIGFKTDGST